MISNSASAYQLQILPALRRIQETYGYLKRQELVRFAKDADIPLHRLQEVASFFPHFHLEPAPVLTLKVCRDMACHLAGAPQLTEELRAAAGEGVSVEGVSCLGRCDRAPAVCVAIHPTEVEEAAFLKRAPAIEGGQELYYLGRGIEELKVIAESHIESLVPTANSDKELSAYPSGEWLIDPYRGKTPHYAALRKVVAARDESAKSDHRQSWIDAVFTEMDEAHASLRGMGGAGVPASQKWRDVLEAVSDARRRGTDERAFVVVNGDESEPGTFKDRELLLHFPHLIVEAVILAGLLTGATEGFIFIRHEYPEQIAACRAEIERAESLGVCGSNASVLGRPFIVSVFVSPGGYICGEQSALIEAMSDRRAEPRNLPPKLETNGLDDRPTLLSNVETYAWVPYIVINGGKTYAELGVNGQKGRRFFSVSGDVKRPGVYEVPMGLTLRELVCGDKYCQGIAGGKRLKAIAPSGPSGGFLPARLTTTAGLPRNHTTKPDWQALALRRGFDPAAQELDILDLDLELNIFRALSPTQSLGAGLVVYAEDRDMAEQAVNALEFYRNESCGKCVPCKIGSQKMANLGTNLLAGHIDAASWKSEMLPLVKSLSEAMGMASICGLGRSVPMPIGTVISFFGDDLARHLK